MTSRILFMAGMFEIIVRMEIKSADQFLKLK